MKSTQLVMTLSPEILKLQVRTEVAKRNDSLSLRLNDKMRSAATLPYARLDSGILVQIGLAPARWVIHLGFP